MVENRTMVVSSWWSMMGILLCLPLLASAMSNEEIVKAAFEEWIEQVQPSVVEIVALKLQRLRSERLTKSQNLSGGQESRSYLYRRREVGSGWVYDDAGHIVTTAGLVNGADRLEVRFEDGRSTEASLVGRDLPTNIAVVQVTAEELKRLPIGNSAGIQRGSWLVLVGRSYSKSTSLSFGIASGVDLLPGYPLSPFIRFEAPVYPGNTGGILLDTTGKAIGMLVAALDTSFQSHMRESTSTPVGQTPPKASQSLQWIREQTPEVGLALPLHFIQPVVDHLIEDGRIERGWLGVLVPVEDPAPFGVTLQHIVPDSPAALAGLREGDCVLSVDGAAVSSGMEFKRIVLNSSPGRRLVLTLVRDGVQIERTVTLGQMPE